MTEPPEADGRQPRRRRGHTRASRPRRAPRPAGASLRPRPLSGVFSGGYSRFVTGMKILLPSLAFLLVALVVLWPQIQETQGRFRLGFAEMSPDEVGGLSMLKVRYTGVDSEDRPFTVTADSAAQADGDANRIALNRPEADITLNDDSWLALGAERGLYAQDIRILDLEGAVNLFHDQGYEITTERARVDLAAGTAVGDRPVRGHGPFGEFEAAGFYILDQGATVFLGGRARLKLYLKGEEGR